MRCGSRWPAWLRRGTDIAFSEARTEGYRAFANKIWNAARFLFMNIDRAREAGADTASGAPYLDSEAWVEAPIETRWILARLAQTSAAVHQALEVYRFDEAANTTYQFFWGDLCDWYLEIIKLRLVFTPKTDNAEALASLRAFTHIFESALRLLSPFMPFITEEIWQALHYNAPPTKSVALTRFPQESDYPCDLRSVGGMTRIQKMITAIRARRKELGVPEKESVSIFVVEDAGSSLGSRNPEINSVYRENEDIILRMARVSMIEYKDFSYLEATSESIGWIQAFGPEVLVLYERVIDVAAERERLSKDLVKYEKGLAAAEKQLNNEAFMAKAPAHIVEGLKKQAAETRLLYEKTRAALEALPPE